MAKEILDIFCGFIDYSPQFGVVCDASGRVLHCNKILQKQCCGEGLVEIFGPVADVVLHDIEKALKNNVLRTSEFEVCWNGEIHAMHARTHPVGTDLVCVLFHSVDSRRQLERIMFDRHCHLPTDGRWILDDQYRVLQFQTDPASVFFGREPGFDIFEAVVPSSHEHLRAVFNEAARRPGKLVNVNVQVRRADGVRNVDGDAVYFPDLFYGNRFYCLTRPSIRTTDHVLNRMLEAYQVQHDAELAECLEVGATAVSNVRTNRREVPDSWLVKCCLECRVNLQWLYASAGPKFAEG